MTFAAHALLHLLPLQAAAAAGPAVKKDSWHCSFFVSHQGLCLVEDISLIDSVPIIGPASDVLTPFIDTSIIWGFA